MLRIRSLLYPFLERAVLGLGLFDAANANLGQGRGQIVFVCTGNICRSPYAESFARRCGLPAISCGTRADRGAPADQTATLEAQERGVTLHEHRTAPWRDVALGSGDIIVAMQLRHVAAVLPRAFAGRCRVLLFSSLLPRFAPIIDPYGQPRDTYRRTFDLIEAGVLSLARLKRPPTL